METGTCWEVWSRRGRNSPFFWARFIDRDRALRMARDLNGWAQPDWNPNRAGEPLDVVCIYEVPIADIPDDGVLFV